MQGYYSVPLVFSLNGNQYKRHEELGRGGFAAVYRVTDTKTGEDYAMKVMNKEKYVKPKSIEKLKSEISIQASLNHPNVLRSFGHYEDARYHYILLELAPGKSVRDMARAQRRLTEKKTAQILKEVLLGVGYLHDNRIIHRDLKLENFLIGKDGKIKVADFGLSAKLDYDDEKKFTVCGTPNYLCPEILRSKGHSYEVDIWAIGVCAYVMLIGRAPFDSVKAAIIYDHIKNGNYSFPAEPRISRDAMDFIKSTLQINPNLRPSVTQLLAHPFITGNVGFDRITAPKPSVKPRIVDERPKPRPLALRPVQENAARPDAPEELIPKYFVSRFCDDKAKGLGYLLADGTVGLIMKDNSRWIMDPHETFVQHYKDYKVTKPEVLDVKDSKVEQILLLLRFSNSLKKLTSMFDLPAVHYSRNMPLRHVKYWLRNNKATLFRMDQKDVQVNFDDKVKVAYFPLSRKMMMVTKLKQRVRPVFVDVLKTSAALTEEKERFNVVRDMLLTLSRQVL